MAKPLRIVSLLASATEILYGLGLADQTVAVSHECDFPPACREKPSVTVSHINSEAAEATIDAQVREKLDANESLYAVDEEALAELRPDLIVTQDQCDVCAVSLADVRHLVASSPDLSKTRILTLNPNSLQEVFEDIARIGVATETENAAESWLTSLRSRVDQVRDRNQSLLPSERPRVLCVEWIDPLMVAGNWTPELLDWAGGKSGLATAGQHSRYHDWSEIQQFDPEVMIIAPCGFGLRRALEDGRTLTTRPGWENIAAVASDRVYVLDGNAYLNRSGPRLVDTLEILASLVQPQLFHGDSSASAIRKTSHFSNEKVARVNLKP